MSSLANSDCIFNVKEEKLDRLDLDEIGLVDTVESALGRQDDPSQNIAPSSQTNMSALVEDLRSNEQVKYSN